MTTANEIMAIVKPVLGEDGAVYRELHAAVEAMAADLEVKSAWLKEAHEADIRLRQELEAAKETAWYLNRALREATESPTFMGEPMQMALATPEGGTRFVNVRVEAAEATQKEKSND
jgi:hypothetical protein